MPTLEDVLNSPYVNEEAKEQLRNGTKVCHVNLGPLSLMQYSRWIVELNLLFVPINKNASNSILEALHNRYDERQMFKIDEVNTELPPDGIDRAVFWRNPADRVVAAVSYTHLTLPTIYSV